MDINNIIRAPRRPAPHRSTLQARGHQKGTYGTTYFADPLVQRVLQSSRRRHCTNRWLPPSPTTGSQNRGVRNRDRWRWFQWPADWEARCGCHRLRHQQSTTPWANHNWYWCFRGKQNNWGGRDRGQWSWFLRHVDQGAGFRCHGLGHQQSTTPQARHSWHRGFRGRHRRPPPRSGFETSPGGFGIKSGVWDLRQRC
jgi:hypothetical protein